MPRKGSVPKRDVLPDPVYGSKLLTRFINKVMLDGKKGVAERIVYDAFDVIRAKTGKDPLEVFDAAMKNVMPVLEVRARRVGGANYQVPVEVRTERKTTLGIRWLVNYARLRGEKPCATAWLARSWMRQTEPALLSRSAKIPTRWPKQTKRLHITAGNPGQILLYV